MTLQLLRPTCAYSVNVALDWNTGSLAEGLENYNAGHFFEAHEHWELIWLKLDEPEKSFLQAIIQITAAMHHLRKGNSDGAVLLLRRSLKRLSQCTSVFGGIDVERLRGELSAITNSIRHEAQPEKITPPRIQPVNARTE